ncbi:M15 family metallopeptidase [Micromonospora psammae]|uniref:M15 family metallopeptidase n=1 Tax=Micromonospora sp. CPCC 205556 TaxID=3122398 RepID=UPI002FF0A869
MRASGPAVAVIAALMASPMVPTTTVGTPVVPPASCRPAPPDPAPPAAALAACAGPAPATTASARPLAAASGQPHAPDDFVVLSDVDSRILTDIRYATAHNFVGRPIAGYAEPLCLLTRAAADALRRVQTAALAQGRSLKVYDCYRPQRAVDDFVRWAKQPGEEQTKAEFYPRVKKSALFDEGYVGAPTAHSSGSTVDLTLVAVPPAAQPAYTPGQPLVACTEPAGRRFADNSIDMGTGFDCFDPSSATDSPRVGDAARSNRALLRQLMTEAGFTNYPTEWWHYRLSAEPYPKRYFDFPVARSSI